MPIKKFKSFENASKDLWVYNPDDKYYQKMIEHFELWSRLSDRKFKKGIQKFRSFDEFIKFKEKEQFS